MQKITIIIVLLISVNLKAQNAINGIVVNSKNEPISGANIYLEGTYDGTTSDENGNFKFKSLEKGQQKLVVSYLSYETFSEQKEVTAMKDLRIILRENINSLDAVVLSAGTFSAGDNSKVSVLKPLDVVTTASALGDFVGALQTLPGTSTVAEDGRLFVRGGDANETQIFIDGIRVFTPYTPSANNTPSRGRYSPFLFDGITFSTGGYSAEYGQALSSVLLLNTINEPDQNETNLGFMSLGLSAGHTLIKESSSLSVNGSYINLAPYNALFPGRNNFIKPFETVSGEAVYRKRTESGLFKFYSAFDATNFELTQEDINLDEPAYFKLNNNNIYLNGSYKGVLAESWTFQSGMSFTHANNRMNVIQRDIRNTENALHAKLKLKKRVSNRFKLNFGTELFTTNFNETYKDDTITDATYGFNSNIMAIYAETDFFASNKMAFKTGVRGEYSLLLNSFNVVPRVSMALKTSEHAQLSLAYGKFYQNPSQAILKFTNNIAPENADHYILNYQRNANGTVFRIEGYYKTYQNLVKYNTDYPDFSSDFSNSGSGFARGVDVFWRDNNSIKNLDYWFSYSLLDTKRDYKNYLKKATPDFVNTHNVSLVGKYWINDWRSQVGFTYNLASGRAFTNPNQPGFLNDKTRAYQSLSLNWAYLLSSQKILYASVNNVLGFRNINGYQYANTPNSQGYFDRQALRPSTDQFFFIGFFWTLSDDKKSNQLDNL